MAEATATTRRAALRLAGAGGGAALLAAAPASVPTRAARAQGSTAAAAWPGSRPIRLIVPFAAGGAADSTARAVAPRLAERIAPGTTVVVENRTGGSGSAGGAVVAQAPPDGHTLMWDASSHVVNPALLRGLAFDYATAFAPVSLAATFPQVLAAKADLPARSVAEFVALARGRTGGLSVGTQGNATAGHMALVALQRATGVELSHVPYRGGADAARDLASGALDGVVITMLSAGPIVDGGRARFLAVGTRERVALRPEVPTFAEAGVAGMEISEWVGLFGPAGLPPEIVARLHAALAGAVAEEEVRARLDRLVAIPVASPPADFAGFLDEGRTRMAALVREARITVD